MKCKFCGAEIQREKSLSPAFQDASCGKCTVQCRTCEKHKTALLSWHAEPCKSCPDNPYNKKHAGGAEDA